MYHLKTLNALTASSRAVEGSTPQRLPPMSLNVQDSKRTTSGTANHKQIGSHGRRPTKATRTKWYDGVLGTLVVYTRSRYSSWPYESSSMEKETMQETSIRKTPRFVRRAFELCFVNYYGQISKTLRIYPVLTWNAPIFILCARGDMRGVQLALSSGKLSPFVVSTFGETLLHVSPMY